MSEMILMNGGTAALTAETVKTLVDLKKAAKVIKEREDVLQAALLAEMKAKGIVKVDTLELLINYIEPTMRESLDGKALRADLPDVYDQYAKLTPVKESIRVKLK